jgi:hypothetical protein
VFNAFIALNLTSFAARLLYYEYEDGKSKFRQKFIPTKLHNVTPQKKVKGEPNNFHNQ